MKTRHYFMFGAYVFFALVGLIATRPASADVFFKTGIVENIVSADGGGTVPCQAYQGRQQAVPVRDNSPSYVGGAVGGAVGAVVGSRFGKGSGNTVSTVVGAVAGAMVGDQIGRNTRPNGYAVRTEQPTYPTGGYNCYQAGSAFYIVTVNINGDRLQFKTTRPYQPGQEIPVRIDINIE